MYLKRNVMKYKTMLLLVLIALVFNRCEVLEPEPSNLYDIKDVKSYVTHAEGILLAAYNNLPENHDNFPLAYGSDDAVTNDKEK